MPINNLADVIPQ